MIKIASLISFLDCEGAERQLVTLAKALAKKGFENTVFCFYSGGVLEKELEDSEVKFLCLEKGGRWHLLLFLENLAK